MSLYDLLKDELKQWLNGRMNLLKLDSGLIFGATGDIGATGSTLSNYEQIIHVCSFSGPFSDTVDTILTRIGNTVIWTRSSFAGTPGASAIITTAPLPERFWPSFDENNSGQWGSDNSVNKRITAVVNATTGVATFGVGDTQAAFTNSGTCSVWSGSMSWQIYPIF